MKQARWMLFMLSILAAGMVTAREMYPIDGVAFAQMDPDRSVHLTAHVVYSNGCFVAGPVQAEVQQNLRRISLQHQVQVRNGLCTQALIPRNFQTDLGRLQPGEYQVVDAIDGSALGNLVVEESAAYFR